jgi:hypothetical protein
MKQLFTRQDIEKFGFIYEPDASKCKTIRIKSWPNESKQEIARNIYTKYVNSVFVNESIQPITGGHWDTKVMIKGHGNIDLL